MFFPFTFSENGGNKGVKGMIKMAKQISTNEILTTGLSNL